MDDKVGRLARTIFACLAGAGGGGLAFTAAFALGLATGYLTQPAGLSGQWRGLLIIFFPSTLATLLPALVIGFPLELLLQKLRITGYLPTVAIFAICGVPILSAIFAPLAHNIADMIFLGATGAFMGFLASSLAWLVRRPDKDVPKDVSLPAS